MDHHPARHSMPCMDVWFFSWPASWGTEHCPPQRSDQAGPVSTSSIYQNAKVAVTGRNAGNPACLRARGSLDIADSITANSTQLNSTEPIQPRFKTPKYRKEAPHTRLRDTGLFHRGAWG